MQNKKAIQFILLFTISYILLNGIYQWVLWLYAPKPDIITLYTSIIFCKIFTKFNFSILLFKPAVLISFMEKGLVNIAEGCNGIAVFNTLLSFIIAFKSNLSKYLKFIPISFAILFIVNLVRLYLLVEIKLSNPQFFDLFHTYIFPIILYFITFLLMIVWVRFFNKKEDVNE